MDQLQLQSCEHQCLRHIQMRTNVAMAIYHYTKAAPIHMGLQLIVRTIISFVLHKALHKYPLEFNKIRPAGIRDQKQLSYHCATLPLTS